MSFEAEFSITHPDMFLLPTIRAVPGARIRHAYQTDTEKDGIYVFVLINGDVDWPDLEEALDDDSTVKGWRCIMADTHPRVYSIEFGAKNRFLMRETATAGIFVEGLWSEEGRLRARFRLPSRRLLGVIRDLFTKYEIEYRLENIHVYTEDNESVANMTDAQLKLLVDAYESGYFDIPRGISQAGLAEKHGITESAVSQQLRRALNNVVGAVLESNNNGNFVTDT